MRSLETLEELVLLLYGDDIPPHKHINKIANKYIHYFLKDKEKEGFIEDEYVEIRIEERYLGVQTRQWHWPPIVPVKREYLLKFINIFKSFTCHACVCNTNHEHPLVSIDGLDYEGYCYYMQDEDKKIIFLEEYGIEDEGVNLIELFETLEKDSTFTMNHLDMNDFIVQKERHHIGSQEWYRAAPVEKRFIIVEAHTDTELAMEQWIKEVAQIG